MRGLIGLDAGRPLLAVLALVLVPGLMLGYFGLSGLAEREDTLRASYAATTALVRDRLAETLTRLESDVPTPKALTDLARLKSNNGWLDHPFILRGNGCVMTSVLTAGCAAESPDPLSGLPTLAARVADAEAAEFARGDLNAALAQYRQALGIVLGSAPFARLFLLSRIGRTLFKLGRFGEATSVYQSLIAGTGDALDRNGLPYALIGLLQLIDLADATGRADAKREAERQLDEFIVERPWDLENGYREYLARVRAAAMTDTALASRVDSLQAAATDIEWIRNTVLRQRLAQPTSAALATTQVGHLAAVRAGRPVLLGFRRLETAAGSADIVGYEIRSQYLSGTMLTDVLEGVSLGSNVRVALVTAPRQAAHPLAESALLPGVSGWNVALFDRNGRSVEQLVRRERWTYGALVMGMLAVMTLGIIVTSRMSSRATELARLQTEFVSNVSHELKTPLALIRMFGETLESGIVVDGAKRQEFYGIIRRESERLTQLINNVLDIGRIDRGTKAYDLQPQDLVNVVREALDAYRPLFDRLGFRIETDLSPSPIRALIDREAIAQALVNLFQNVIKYSDDAHFVGVFVGIRAGEACVSVADHGIGIPREHVPKIFDRYYRIPPDASTASPGSGLGLAIVKHAIDAHGGRIDVKSTVGQGSVFTLALPLAADTVAATREPPEHQRASA